MPSFRLAAEKLPASTAALNTDMASRRSNLLSLFERMAISNAGLFDQLTGAMTPPLPKAILYVVCKPLGLSQTYTGSC